MINYEKLHNSLTSGFIEYQYNLDFPFPYPWKTIDDKILHYKTNAICRAKVDQLVAGVILIIQSTEDS
jgi:hypothetical protein